MPTPPSDQTTVRDRRTTRGRSARRRRSIEELARDIERRGLLQSLNVRPVLDGEGTETGSYEVPAGGRRFRALELLVKQKKLAKTALVPCVVREAGSIEVFSESLRYL